jgi:electron transfer flavoprotein alpha subunit
MYCWVTKQYISTRISVQVLRELSDQVVSWQDAHNELSRDLVAQKMRVAELQTEHDKLIAIIKDLVFKNQQHQQEKEEQQHQQQQPRQRQQQQSLPQEVSRVRRSFSRKESSSSSKKEGPSTGKMRMGFLGRLKTPRNRD